MTTNGSESYDDRQIQARLVKCAQCGREYFMTAPRAKCLACAPFTKAPATDVNGVPIDGP